MMDKYEQNKKRVRDDNLMAAFLMILVAVGLMLFYLYMGGLQ